MSSDPILLPEPLRGFVDRRTSEGGFTTLNDYIANLVREDMVRSGLTESEIEAAIAEVIDGPFDPYTKEDLEWVRREGERILAERKRH